MFINLLKFYCLGFRSLLCVKFSLTVSGFLWRDILFVSSVISFLTDQHILGYYYSLSTGNKLYTSSVTSLPHHFMKGNTTHDYFQGAFHYVEVIRYFPECMTRIPTCITTSDRCSQMKPKADRDAAINRPMDDSHIPLNTLSSICLP